MSLPAFPTYDPPLTQEDAINQILSSIAMEELALSHVLNAEGEKLQYAIGTLPEASGSREPATIKDLLELNLSVRNTLDSVMQNQIFLKLKLKAALASSAKQIPPEESNKQAGNSHSERALPNSTEPYLAKTYENIANPGGDAYPGDRIKYTIMAANYGGLESVWPNVVIVDILPEGMTFIDESVQINGEVSSMGTEADQYTYDIETRTLRVFLGDIGSGDQKFIAFQTQINPDAYGISFTNTATAESNITGSGEEIEATTAIYTNVLNAEN